MATPQVLRAKIIDQFKSVPKPTASNIAHGNLEAIRLTSALQNREWESLVPDYCESHNDALTFMTPEAFHYYLQAYLINSLREENGKVNGDCFTLYKLELPGDPELDAWVREKFRFFDNGQIEVLIEYLEFMRDNTGYRNTIDYAAAIAFLQSQLGTAR